MANPVVHDRVTTTSASGKRIKVNPIPVEGKWKSRRFWFQWGLIALYVTLPWIKINGHPLFLLDIQHRRFSLFGNLFFAHEVPYLLLLSLSFFLWIGLVTALFGRAWCGWACPQTIFVENIFRKIEVALEGDLGKKRTAFTSILKWGIFAGIAIILSHSFLAYFVGSEASLKMMTQAPSENWVSFIFTMAFTGIVLFDFGWFREQFCLIACPYGRFQSVMMDSASLSVTFDTNRNDCIDCFKCVRVCPTGIDIRNGTTQMECIACTACMDACDGIMTKIHKPLGLISYQSEFTLKKKKNPWIRPRTIAYGTFIGIFLSVFVFLMEKRSLFQEEVARAVDTPYQLITLESGEEGVINHFKIRFYNLDWISHHASFELSAESQRNGISIASATPLSEGVEIPSGKSAEIQFFIKAPKKLFKDPSIQKALLQIDWKNEEHRHVQEVKLIGPNLSI